MSEKIKITVVVHDEKPNVENETQFAGKITLTQTSSLTLLPILLKKGLMDGSLCGGRGDCGRCIVQFLEGAPIPTGIERSRLGPDELRRGYRLACVARPKTDCTIRIVGAEERETPIVTEWQLLSGNIDLYSQTKSLSENQKPCVMKSGVNVRYMIAVDLGTTTIAMQLRESASGAVSDTYCEKNPQSRYGTDVLARIQASVDGHGEELRGLVCGVILRGLGQFAEYLRGVEPVADLQEESCGSWEEERGGAQDGWSEKLLARVCGKIVCMCIAGNTVMEHLLLGYDAEGLGKSPFTPRESGLQIFSPGEIFHGYSAGFHAPGEKAVCLLWDRADFPVYIAPCISGFVGGDIVAGLYALRLFSGGGFLGKGAGKTEQPASVRQAVLFIDLGTNGEMVLTDGRRMIATATAAGPAFEGDGSVIGTDRIAFTAELLRRGILDETGLLEEPYFTEGVPMNPDGSISWERNAAPAKDWKSAAAAGVYVYRQKDVRALQMAKAAVRAGVEILWEKMERPEIGRVFLAGGFGYYLNVEAAVSIGLLPARVRGRVQAVGNTSLAGAYELGRDLCADEEKARTLEKTLSGIESINLAAQEHFETRYLQYMNLEEN